jgi:LysM repeat protein
MIGPMMLDAISGADLQGLSVTNPLDKASLADGAFQMLLYAKLGGNAFDVYKLSDQLNIIGDADPTKAASLQSEIMLSLNIVEQAQLQALQAQSGPQKATSWNTIPSDTTTPYVVKKDETVVTLAKKFSVTQQQLVSANFENARNSPTGTLELKEGMIINMPQGLSNIVVKPGEKVADIAKTYGVTEAQILRTNGYQKAADVMPGDKLLIVPKNEVGLDKDRSVIEFVKAMKALGGPNPNSENGKWSLNDKEKYLEKTVNAQLAKLGLPNLDIKVADIDEKGLANYNFVKHQITIDKKFLSLDLTKPENLQLLSQAVYHEARHAEQTFNMARVQAALETGNPKEIARKIQQNTGLNKQLANAAAKIPIDLKSKDGVYFMAMHESLFGKSSANTQGVYKDRNDGNVTEADDAAYRRLPMELDAFRVGGKVDVYF